MVGRRPLLTDRTYETNGTWVGFAFPVWYILLPPLHPDEDEDDDEYEDDGPPNAHKPLRRHVHSLFPQ